MTSKTLFIVNLIVTLFLTGLIWTIQVVHYPLFAKVGAAQWRDYHAAHNAAITVLVALPMLIELVLSFGLIVLRPEPLPMWVAYAGCVLALIVWAATAALSVPVHSALADRLDTALVNRLVLTNWVRTLAWTAHSVLLVFGLGKLLA
jgi:hypothetical protein